MALILLGAATLSWPDQPGWGGLLPGLAVAGACLGWAVDNNLTQRLSGRDPFTLVRAKTVVAGTVNLALAARATGSVRHA